MDEGFELPVVYKGKELLLPAKINRFGYSYKIEVEVSGTLIFFEKDEERNWRALINEQKDISKIDAELVNLIIGVLNEL